MTKHDHEEIKDLIEWVKNKKDKALSNTRYGESIIYNRIQIWLTHLVDLDISKSK